MSFYIQNNEQLIKKTWKKEPYDVHSNFYTELLYEQLIMYRHDGAGVNPNYPFTTDTSPRHKLQLWEMSPEDYNEGKYKVSIKHAAEGKLGAFFITAWADTNNDGMPDVEIGHSSEKIATKKGEWSSWDFCTFCQHIFVGYYWNDSPKKIYYTSRKAYESWKGIGNTMYYLKELNSTSFNSVSPRYTNIHVLKIDENKDKLRDKKK